MRLQNLVSRCCFSVLILAKATAGQQAAEKLQNTPSQIQVQANLVVTPVLVKDGDGSLVYSLTADDFVVRDNGVEQKIRLENNVDLPPLALVIAVQTAGNGARQQ